MERLPLALKRALNEKKLREDAAIAMHALSVSEARYRTLVENAPEAIVVFDEALRLAQGERPALAVLDVVMPKMGGQAALARLLERFPGLPAIFTSGYSHDATGLPSSSPETTYLQKLYSPTALGKLVRQVLDQALVNLME